MYNVMKSKSKWLAVAMVAALLVPVGVASAAPSVDDVIAKYVKASGGAKKIDGIKSVVKKGEMIIVDMGMTAGLESTKSGDNFKNRISIEGMGEITQAITDGTAWQIHFMEGDSILEGDKADDVVQQADDFAWQNWKNYFASAEVAGEEDGDVKVVFKAKGDGEDTTAFFSSDTGLLHKLDSVGPDGSAATLTFSDYKAVGGLQFAHKTEIAGAMNIEMIFATIEVNVDVDASVFEIPEAIKAMMPAAGLSAADVMEMMDGDGDGKITMEEAPEELKASFGMVDMNGDDVIDIEEAQLIADFINNQ